MRYWVVQKKNPGLSGQMPDPNPDKFWEIFAFSLCEIPTKSLQIARRLVANPDKKLAGGKFLSLTSAYGKYAGRPEDLMDHI